MPGIRAAAPCVIQTYLSDHALPNEFTRCKPGPVDVNAATLIALL